MTTLFVAAADPSGDALLAAVVPLLRNRVPGLAFVGLAGPLARAVGVHAIANAEDFGGVGLVEAVRSVPSHLRLLGRLQDAAVACGAAVALTIDAPSLLLRLGRRLRGHGMAVVHWVSPQVWAWRPGRVAVVARSVDTVLCLFPWEPQWYAGHVRAVFVGHPAAAIEPESLPEGARPWIALCPGSRPGEVRGLWPVLRQVARAVSETVPAQFVVPVGSVDPAWLDGLAVLKVKRMAQVAGAAGAVVASGTATLELAAMDVPMVAVYRVHPLTAFAARRLLTVDRVALPNLLGAGDCVPEHLQQLDPRAIAQDLVSVLGRRGQVPRNAIASLQGPGALTRVADEVAAWLLAR